MAQVVGGGVAGVLNSLSQWTTKEVGGMIAAAWGSLGNRCSQTYCRSALSKDVNSLKVHL